MRSTLLVFVPVLLFFSCNESLVHTEYTALRNGIWNKKDTVRFLLQDVDTITPHNVFLNVRNDNRYEFSNLFLILELEAPSGNTKVDTLEYEMAMPTGEWLGRGMGSLKESKLWYKENIVFEESGVYSLSVLHAMRKNGEVNGLENLQGITDVGIQIEKVQQ